MTVYFIGLLRALMLTRGPTMCARHPYMRLILILVFLLLLFGGGGYYMGPGSATTAVAELA